MHLLINQHYFLTKFAFYMESYTLFYTFKSNARETWRAILAEHLSYQQHR